MRYQIFITPNIEESLEGAQPIGAANSYLEVCKEINNYLSVINFHQEPYWRFLMEKEATFIDYGSWSKFIAIVPPLSIEDMSGDKQ